MARLVRLPKKPEARTEKVESLVEKVLRGYVRVPLFQRRLKWLSQHVVDLFDSIYRGYPIGSLLFYQKPADAQRLEVGPLTVNAPEIGDAWWVVDGQQRVTTLTACLGRPLPLPTRPNQADPFVLFFDASSQRFEPPSPDGEVPTTWVPLPSLLDASRLSEWVYGWAHQAEDSLRRIVFEAGARIREYAIPLYLIETEESGVAEHIFYRVNLSGAPLEWAEVHRALFGGEGTHPSTLAELSEELAEVGMGTLDEKRLLTCLFALRGLDPTRTFDEHYRRDPAALSNAVQEALPVLRRVLSFLRRDASIPHVRLLPKSILLDVLTRFFFLHAEPKPRTRILLTRWFWRSVLGGGLLDDRTLRRRGIAAVGDDEEASAQELLALVDREPRRPPQLPRAFDPRADESRIALLALSQLGPRNLGDGAPIDVAELVESEDKRAFVQVVSRPGVGGGRSAANRIIHPGGASASRLLRDRIETHGPKDPAVSSHAIDPEAAKLLRSGDEDGFLKRRAETLKEETRRFADRMAAWGYSDRPSVDYLLAEAGVEL
jgi:Protein of unknown function DUF262